MNTAIQAADDLISNADFIPLISVISYNSSRLVARIAASSCVEMETQNEMFVLCGHQCIQGEEISRSITRCFIEVVRSKDCYEIVLGRANVWWNSGLVAHVKVVYTTRNVSMVAEVLMLPYTPALCLPLSTAALILITLHANYLHYCKAIYFPPYLFLQSG